MEKRCCNENAYYKYRKNRVELLEDHESKVEEEPFHKRYLKSLERFSSKEAPAARQSMDARSSKLNTPTKMSEKLKDKRSAKKE